MPASATIAEVLLWDRVIGAIAWDPLRRVGTFEYAAEFLASGFELAPLTMPLRPGVFLFPELYQIPLAFRLYKWVVLP